MGEENEQTQVEQETVEQEETTQPEEELNFELDLSEEEQEKDESTVAIDKTELNRLRRKAIAYDTAKSKMITKTAPKTDAVSDERLERLELRAEGYSPDEIQEIMDLGGTKVLSNKVVQNAIKAMRAEKKSKESSTDVSSKSPVYKKYTQQDLSKMSAMEMEKILTD